MLGIQYTVWKVSNFYVTTFIFLMAKSKALLIDMDASQEYRIIQVHFLFTEQDKSWKTTYWSHFSILLILC